MGAGRLSLAPLLAAAVAVLRAARKGPARLTLTFVAAGMAVGATAIALAVMLGRLLSLALAPLLIWMGIFYCVGLMTEGLWLSSQLARGAYDRSRQGKAGNSTLPERR